MKHCMAYRLYMHINGYKIEMSSDVNVRILNMYTGAWFVDVPYRCMEYQINILGKNLKYK